MKNAIRYYYQIEVNQLDRVNHRYLFDSYLLQEVDREFPESLYQLLLGMGYPIYRLIANKDQQYITKIEDKYYLLMQMQPSKQVGWETIEQFQIPMQQVELLPWHELWMNKVDYYEKHVSTITNDKILNSFFYYIGLSENAISFYQMIKKKGPLFISHYRMNNDMDYWNPLNLTLDYRVRDIAEYTKRKFFEDDLLLSDLYFYFYRNQFQVEDYLLFYARMLFPSYYFDCYDAIVNGEDDECLDCYLQKIDDYEQFLRELYLSFSQVLFLPKIDWIVEQ